MKLEGRIENGKQPMMWREKQTIKTLKIRCTLRVLSQTAASIVLYLDMRKVLEITYIVFLYWDTFIFQELKVMKVVAEQI